MLMFGGGAMLAAAAATSLELAFAIEGIIEGGHRLRPFVAAVQRKPVPLPGKVVAARPFRRRAATNHAGSMPLCLLRWQRWVGLRQSAAPGRATIRSRSRNTCARL